MDAFIDKLAQSSFVRIHQRFVINTHKKFEIMEDYILIKGTELSISLKYKKELKEKLNL